MIKSKEILEVLPQELVQETEKNCRKKEVYVEDLPVQILHTTSHMGNLKLDKKFHLNVVIDAK